MSAPVPPQLPAGANAGSTGFDLHGLRDQFAKQANFSGSLAVDMLFVATDRLRLRLRDFESATRARLAWSVPLSLGLGFLGMLLTVTAVEQLELFGLKKDAWIGICTAGLVLCVLATIGLGVVAAMKWKGGSAEAIVESLRRSEPKA